MTQRVLEDLAPEECVRLLHQQEVGRLVYVDGDGPLAVPVNYAVDGNRIVFRIEHSPKELDLKGAIAFEVDHFHESNHSGWSVLLRGTGREIPLDEVPEVLHRIQTHFPRPWAAGVHNVWVSLDPAKITGKRFGPPAL